ncbi:hypothetical protein JCM10021v2_001685 [Rhodotorula toruloides]
MARTPFRSCSGLSGPQPTHTSLGKAPGSTWGTKRAKAGQRVRRKGVFPSSDEEGGTGRAKGVRRKLVSSQRASSSRASETRAFAALARTSSARRRSPPPHLANSEDESDDEDEIDWSLGDKRLGRKRREVGSSDPDASLSEDDDSDLEVKVVPPQAPQPKHPPPRNDSPDAAALRRLRADAALKRLEKSKVIEVLDSTEEEEVKQREMERLQAGPNSLGPRREKGKSVSPKGKKGGKKVKKGKGRRLTDPDGEGEDVEQFRRRMKREAEAKKRREKGKEVQADGRLFRDGSAEEEEDLKPLDFAANAADDDSDDDLHPLDRPARAASSSAATSTRRRTHRRRTSPPSSASDSDANEQHYDSRALRRARTSGTSASQFINDSDDERDAAVRGGGRWIETGGSGGRIRIGATGGGADGAKGKKPAEKKKKVVKPARGDSSDDGADDAPASSSDYAHLNLPRFIDPRADLARRKKRELSSPPTSAFESSDGEGPRIVSGREQDELDKFERLDRRMKRKKAKYREERRPGYSNPRRN